MSRQFGFFGRRQVKRAGPGELFFCVLGFARLFPDTERKLLELHMQVMHLDFDQPALIVEKGVRLLAARPGKSQSRCSRINPTGYRLSAGILTFDFLRHPAPTALDLRLLRQTGTLLATGKDFERDDAVFQAVRRGAIAPGGPNASFTGLKTYSPAGHDILFKGASSAA